MTTERRLRTMEENLQILTDLTQTFANSLAAQEARQNDQAERLNDHDQPMSFLRETNRIASETNQALLTVQASQQDRVLDDQALPAWPTAGSPRPTG